MNGKSGAAPTKRGYLVPNRIIERAYGMGITLAELQNMVRLSARVTHEAGNRRYQDYYFLVEGNRVLEMTHVKEVATPAMPLGLYDEQPPRVRCQFCNDRKTIRTFDECGVCEGVGCRRCDGGLVPSSIPCPMCVERSALSRQVV